jgi:hypothetical protein
MQCPRCQAENRAGRRFCAECGAPLALRVLRLRERARGKILRWLWHTSGRSASPPGAASTYPAVLHTRLSGRKDSHR